MRKKKKWTTILVKEAKRSPLKAAALLGLAVVASYLWGGRIFRPVTVDGESEPSFTPMSALTTQAGSADGMTAYGIGRTSPGFEAESASNAPSGIGTPTPVWVQFQDWLSRQKNEGDEAAAFWRDPFQPPVTVTTETEPNVADDQPSDKSEDATIGPEDLGLELRGVIIGKQGNLAFLGDQVVQAGSQVIFNKRGRKIPVRITEITNEHLSLEIGDKEYELSLPPLTSIESP